MAERWLVIDDSSTIQRVIKLAFQGYDVQISEADSCQDAAREIMQGQPTLIIADAALGGVQGVQDFLALKTQAAQAPFIILEGSYDNIDELQFRNAGFRHFLKKPFDAAQLLSVTRQALGRALPYRGEAAVGANSGGDLPPPPPPLRSTRSNSDEGRPGGSFPPEMASTGFDLGLREENNSTPQATATSMPLTLVDRAAMAQTVVAAAAPHAHSTVSPSIQVGRKDPFHESTKRSLSFSLDEESETKFQQPAAKVSNAAWNAPKEREVEAPLSAHSWEGMPRPAGSNITNLLEPMLHEEMEKLVRVAVEDYCRKHFPGIARELIQRELDRLTQDRSRLLID